MSEIYDGIASPIDQSQVVPPPAPLQLPDKVAALVGPGKKYATVEAALAALPDAQSHIERLESENASFRQNAEASASVDEVYALVRQNLERDRLIGNPVQLDATAVAGLVSTQMKAIKDAEVEQANVSSFKSALAGKFGEKAPEVYRAEAAKAGLSIAQMDNLVKTSPAAALKLLGVEAAPKPPVTYQGGVNTEALGLRPQQPVERKSVMYGADTSQMLDAWRAARPSDT